jgi:hypothetical protein
MWQTRMQVDAWINLGGAGVRPDEWVRVSEIQRVQMVEGAKTAQIILRSGDRIASSHTAQQIMKMIAKVNNDDK